MTKGRKRSAGAGRSDRLKIVAGTVLAIPLCEGEWALGQVIFPGVSFYMGVVLERFTEPLSPKDVDGRPLGLCAWTNDGQVYRDEWRNLGAHEIQEYGPLPEFKVQMRGEFVVTSFFGEVIREYDPEADQALQYRWSWSPALLQRAVRAALGDGEWLEVFDQAKALGAARSI